MLASTIPAILSLVLLGSVSAHPVAETEWYQARDSEIASLFRRQRQAPAANDPNFASNYPAGGSTPPASSLPKAWTDKLATIQLPAGINPSAPNNGYPTYTGNEKGGDQHICSFTYECTTSEDLVAPRDGVLALSFDDGPTPNSPALYEFLAQNNMSTHATHFMIGSNILYNPTGMQAASNAGGHLAVHTWSHQYTTTLSNEGVLAELGWTMQIIADLNGGRIPKYWRPPFGDVDNRVRAIAKGVFGLETVPWSHDSGDWGVTAGNYPKSQVDAQMEQWITGPKSPGLNILEHEQGENPVNIFITAFPKMVSNGWNILNIAEAWNMDWYVNAASQTSSVTQMAVGGDFVARNSTSASASPSASASSASASASASASVSRASASASNSAASRSASASVSRASAGASPSPTSAAGQSINLVSAGWIVGAIGAAAAMVL